MYRIPLETIIRINSIRDCSRGFRRNTTKNFRTDVQKVADYRALFRRRQAKTVGDYAIGYRSWFPARIVLSLSTKNCEIEIVRNESVPLLSPFVSRPEESLLLLEGIPTRLDRDGSEIDWCTARQIRR